MYHLLEDRLALVSIVGEYRSEACGFPAEFIKDDDSKKDR